MRPWVSRPCPGLTFEGDSHVFHPLRRSPVATPSSPEETPYLFQRGRFLPDDRSRHLPRRKRESALWGRAGFTRKMAQDPSARRGPGSKVQYRPHAGRCRRAWHVRGARNPITVSPTKAPLPDPGPYSEGLPTTTSTAGPRPADVGLVRRAVLDQPENRHRGQALGLCLGRHPGLLGRQTSSRALVHAHSDPVPSEGRFASSATVRRGETFPVSRLDGVQVYHDRAASRICCRPA